MVLIHFVGSAEGFTQADKVINASSKSGRWVLLKNVHLAPNWLVSLEKKLHSLTPHPSFRLFLTMEINPKVRFVEYIMVLKKSYFQFINDRLKGILNHGVYDINI